MWGKDILGAPAGKREKVKPNLGGQGGKDKVRRVRTKLTKQRTVRPSGAQEKKQSLKRDGPVDGTT